MKQQDWQWIPPLVISLHNLRLVIGNGGVRAETAAGIVFTPETIEPIADGVAKWINRWSKGRALRAVHAGDWKVRVLVDEDADTSWMNHAAEPDIDCDEDHSTDPQYLVGIIDEDENWLTSLGGVHLGPNGTLTGDFDLDDFDSQDDYISGLVDDGLEVAEESEKAMAI